MTSLVPVLGVSLDPKPQIADGTYQGVMGGEGRGVVVVALAELDIRDPYLKPDEDNKWSEDFLVILKPIVEPIDTGLSEDLTVPLYQPSMGYGPLNPSVFPMHPKKTKIPDSNPSATSP